MKRKFLDKLYHKNRQAYNSTCGSYQVFVVMIDQHLNWKAHIDYVVKKLSYAARILVTRHYVHKQAQIKSYYSFGYPYLKHGIISWGSACQTSLEKIQVVQSNIIRIMNFRFVKDKLYSVHIHENIES